MREFAKSMISFTWGMSLLGTKQVFDAMSNPTTASTKARKAFDATTAAAGAQMDEMFRSLFLAGDSIQREISDLVADMFTPEVLNPASAVNVEMLHRIGETARSLNPGQEGMLTWREFRNKLEVFQLVYRGPALLGLPDKEPYPPLPDSLEKAYDQGEYAALWAVEGLGHHHGDTFWARDLHPKGILNEKTVGKVPNKSLTMLHAGIGMSFAQHWMKTINHRSPISHVRSAVEQFIGLCRDNSCPGYEGAALESLGLLARNGQFYGETRPEKMVEIIGRELAEMDTEVFDTFWHGVGRATYFLPINFVPGYGATWHALDMVRREATDVRARMNALSGLAWAVTMVNIRHPEVLAALFKRLGSEESDYEAFSNGVTSSIIMRADTTPGASFIESLYGYEVRDESLREKWADRIRKPCERALRDHHPVLKRHGRLGEIFRYQSLARLIEKLDGVGAPGSRTEAEPG